MQLPDQFFFVRFDAVVFDIEAIARAGFPAFDGDRAFGVAVFDGVDDQIVDGPFDHGPIHAELGNHPDVVELDLNSIRVPRVGSQHTDDAGEDVAFDENRRRCERAELTGRDIELGNEIQREVGRTVEVVEMVFAPRFTGFLVLAHAVEGVADHRQR